MTDLELKDGSVPASGSVTTPGPDGEFKVYCTGDDYFPAVFKAIESAKEEIFFEVYIFRSDMIGHRVAEALANAAKRGVRVTLIVDGWGGRPLAHDLFQLIGRAGGNVFVFRPVNRFFPFVRRFALQRTHRKLVAVDGRVAFVGGINVIDEQLESKEKRARALFDYAIGFEGELARAVGDAVDRLRERSKLVAPVPAGARRRWWHWRRRSTSPGAVFTSGEAKLVLRDQDPRSRRAIEDEYERLIREARREILIANAYFLPRRKMVKSIIEAARRGVQVRLLLQDKTDTLLIRWATRSMYLRFDREGVEVYEDSETVVHAKVAVFDRETLTVGSSNLDPLSLESNLEANVFVKNPPLAEALARRLEEEMKTSNREVAAVEKMRRSLFRRVLSSISLSLARLIAVWVLPQHGDDF